jgi:hypothetical protein
VDAGFVDVVEREGLHDEHEITSWGRAVPGRRHRRGVTAADAGGSAAR